MPKVLFSFFILCSYYILKFPSLSYNSEIWDEHGSKYLYHAYNGSVWENIWTPDVVYLVWLPRLVSVIIASVASPYVYIYLTNLAGLVFIAFCASFVNFGCFRSIIKSDWNRFFMSLCLGILIFCDYRNFTYMNFVYHGFVPCVLALCVGKMQISKGGMIAYSMLISLLCISKLHYVLFLPFYLFKFFRNLKGNRGTSVFFLPSITTLSIQALYCSYNIKNSGSGGAGVDHEGFAAIVEAMARGSLSWIYAWSIHFEFLGVPLVANVVALMAMAICAFVFYKNRSPSTAFNKVIVLFVAMNMIALGYGIVNGTRSFVAEDNHSLYMHIIHFNRWDIMLYTMVWMSLWIFLSNIENTRLKNVFISMFLLLTLKAVPLERVLGSDRELRNDASDWKSHHVLFDQERYMIPANPWGDLKSGYSILKGCHVIGFYEEVSLIRIDQGSEISNIVAALIWHPEEEVLFAVAFLDGKEVGRFPMLSREPLKNKLFSFGSDGIIADVLVFENGLGERIQSPLVRLYGYP